MDILILTTRPITTQIKVTLAHGWGMTFSQSHIPLLPMTFSQSLDSPLFWCYEVAIHYLFEPSSYVQILWLNHKFYGI